MDDDVEFTGRLPATEGEKAAISLYLRHRRRGVQKAIESLTRARSVDPTSFSANSLAYYQAVDSYLLQAIYQLERTNVNKQR